MSKLSSKFKSSRRGVLGGIGASAIAASAGIFGLRPDAAAAAPEMPSVNGPLCCNLAHPSGPHNIAYSDCVKNASYIWYCDWNAYLHCACCETPNNADSAAYCHYN